MTFTRFVRFVLVGGFATAIQYILLIAFVQLLQTDAVIASGIGFVVSAFANYIINYHYTFASSEKHVTALSKFAVLASMGLLLNSGIMSLLVRNGVFYILAQVVATVIVLLWNFVGNSLWTFREPPRSDKPNIEPAHAGVAMFCARNRTNLLLLLTTVAVRALVALVSNNEPGDADARAIGAALWADNPSLIDSGWAWFPFHDYAAGFFNFFFADPVVAGKWLSFLTGSFSVIPFYRLVRREFDASTAIIASVFFAFYGSHVGASSLVTSEAPFCFFVLWALAVFFAAWSPAKPRPSGFLAAAFLIALAGGFRQEGWMMAGILTLFLLWKPGTRRYTVPFGLIAISPLVLWSIGNAVAGQGWLYALTTASDAKDHETLFYQFGPAKNAVKWVWILLQSPGPLISVLAAWGLVMAARGRLPLQLAFVAAGLILPLMIVSIIKPQWGPEHRDTVLAGILLLPYAGAAARSLLEKRHRPAAWIAGIVIVSIGTQALAYQRHNRWSLPFHHYEEADPETWRALAQYTQPGDVILIEDLDWRSPGFVLHSGLFRHEHHIIFARGDLAGQLSELMADKTRSYVVVLHSEPKDWPSLAASNPVWVSRNQDFRIARVGSAVRDGGAGPAPPGSGPASGAVQ